MLPAGRHLSAEDHHMLMSTPSVKIIHRGPPGTSGYFVSERYDPVALAKYERRKLSGFWDRARDLAYLVPKANEPQRLMKLLWQDNTIASLVPVAPKR